MGEIGEFLTAAIVGAIQVGSTLIALAFWIAFMPAALVVAFVQMITGRE